MQKQAPSRITRLKVLLRRLANGLIAFVGLWLVFVLVTGILQDSAITQIAELTGTRIEAHSVDFDFNGSVLIKKLVIRPDREPRYDDAILKAEKTYARFSIASLLLLRPRLNELRLEDFVFNAQYDLDSRLWNVAELKIRAPKAGTGKMPLVRLERGRMRYLKVSESRINVIASIPIDARFGPAERSRNAYSFAITTAKSPQGSGKSNLRGLWRQGYISVHGGISSTDIPAFEKAWSIDALTAQFYYDLSKNYALKLKIKDLRSKQATATRRIVMAKPRFLEKIGAFAAVQRFFTRYQPFGLVDVELNASGNLRRLGETELAGKIYCRDVSICYRKFPYTIEHLDGWINFTESSVSLDNLYGRHGDVGLFFNGFTRGIGADLQYQIRIISDNMVFDTDLYDALSTKQKKFWSAFSPSGVAAIDYRLRRKSSTEKTRTLTVELHDGEASYRNFPYPLKNLKGTLFFEQDAITICDMISHWDGRKIKLNGKVTSLGTERPEWDISLRANDIPLDSSLIAALPERDRHYFSRFEAAGAVDIDELTGRVWSEKQRSRPCYRLALQSRKLQLNDDLLGLLGTKFKRAAWQTPPAGKVNVGVYLDNPAGAEIPEYKVIVECLGNRVKLKKLPYPLVDITGRLTITKDSLELQDIAATVEDDGGPNRPTITISGQVGLADNRLGPGSFGFSAAGLCLDEKLCDVLPKGIRTFYTRVSPSGRLDLDIENIRFFNSDAGERCIDFAAAARVRHCRLNMYPPATDLDATLKMKGLYKDTSGLCAGSVALCAHSLRINGKAITELKADVCYDPNRRSWRAENLTAESCNGAVAGRFELMRPATSAWRYTLQVGFDDVDVRQFLLEPGRKGASGQDCTTGRMDGSLSLSAAVGDGSNCAGRCRLAINDMQIGRLSPMAKLLTVLKLTEPADFAFEQMLVDSYIQHGRILVDKFDLSGPRVAFNGSGRMDLKGENIDLALTARGSRLATDEPSLLGSLTEGLGHAVVRMDVTGSIREPEVKTTALPVIKETLMILGTRPARPTR